MKYCITVYFHETQQTLFTISSQGSQSQEEQRNSHLQRLETVQYNQLTTNSMTTFTIVMHGTIHIDTTTKCNKMT